MAITNDSIKQRIYELLETSKALSSKFATNAEQIEQLRSRNVELEPLKVELQKRQLLLSRQITETEQRMTDVLRKLIEVEKLSAESHRLRGGLIERSVMDDERINILEAMLREAQEVAMRAERKYAEATQQYIIHEELLGESDKMTEGLEKKVRELEREIVITNNKLAQMKVSHAKNESKEKDYQQQIKELRANLEKAERRALNAQEDALKHQKEICLISDELSAVHERRGLLRTEMERMMSGVQDL